MIRVLGFWYWDLEDDKWRYENIPNIIMGPGGPTSGPRTGTLTETLERVRDEPVPFFRVNYQRCADPTAQNQSCPVFETTRRNSRAVGGIPAMETCQRKDRLRLIVEE